jgi:hypothetical protein
MGRRSSAVVAVLATLCLAAPAGAAQSPSCQAMTVAADGDVTATSQTFAVTHPRRYGTNTALWTSVRGVSCAQLAELLRTVLVAPTSASRSRRQAGG